MDTDFTFMDQIMNSLEHDRKMARKVALEQQRKVRKEKHDKREFIIGTTLLIVLVVLAFMAESL